MFEEKNPKCIYCFVFENLSKMVPWGHHMYCFYKCIGLNADKYEMMVTHYCERSENKHAYPHSVN